MLLAMGLCSRQSLGDPGRYRFLQTVTSPPQDFLKRERERERENGEKCIPTLKCSQVISGHTPLVKTGHIIGINSFMLNGKGRDFEILVSMSNVCQTHSLK